MVGKFVDSGAYPRFYGITLRVENDAIHDVKIKGQSLDLQKNKALVSLITTPQVATEYPLVKNLKTYVNTGYIDAQVLKK